MIALDLGSHRKARVWLTELPNVPYQVEEIREYHYEAWHKAEAVATQAAIEVLIPRGGRAQYGFLGGEFVPCTSAQLIAKLFVSGRNGETVEWSLATAIDTVRAGLPREYANAVLEGSRDASAVLGAGILQLNCAAHGEIGSSALVFRHLARILIKLFTLESRSQLEKTLAPIVSM